MKKIEITIFTCLLCFCLITGYGQGIIVPPGTDVTVGISTTLDISITGGNLTLQSDASDDASFIDYGSITYSGGGEAKVQRYITNGQWHLISSPVSNAVSGMFHWDYLQYHTELTNGWTDIIPLDIPLNIMQGYTLWTIDAAPTVEVFEGTTNTGTYNKGFTQNGLGYNLVGNPFPCTIDWDAVTIPTELSGAIWLFDPTIGANGDYRYYINGGGASNTTSQYIPSGQGFFIRATGGSGTLTFDNSDRVHGGQAFYKNTEDQASLVLKATGNNITTQTGIRFNENATQKVDRLFDVYKIFTDSPDVPVLFTMAEKENLAINTLPAIKENESIPLWFRAGMDGKYSILATEIETFDNNISIYIEDPLTGVIQNLRSNPQYEFYYKSGNDRKFYILFNDPAIINNQNEAINIYSFDNLIHVNFPVSCLNITGFKTQIAVYDLMGKQVINIETSIIHNQIPIDKSALYIVKVIFNDNIISEKVYIK
ncbi:MAG: T9SS type A sorting domain-containing protein [Bacteroidales bacterium]|nr:T9SS type A sorting domain-containing protein [Bacteroidales bacterium]